MKIKLLKVYLPFVCLSLCFTAIYAFIYWLAVINLDLFRPDGLVAHLIVPIAISFLIVFFYYKHRLRLLNLNERAFSSYTMLVGILLAMPLFKGLPYLENAQGELVRVAKPSQINHNRQALFYSVQQGITFNERAGLFVDRQHVSRSTDIVVTCYFASPLLDVRSDGRYVINEQNTWIGVKYSEIFSHGMFDNDVNRSMSSFIKDCTQKYINYKYDLHYLRNLKYDDERREYYRAIVKADKGAGNRKLVILTQEEGSYEARAGYDGYWFWGILISVNIIWLFFVLLPGLNETELNKSAAVRMRDKRRQKEQLMAFLDIFIPKKGMIATPILVDLNILFFLVMILAGVDWLYPIDAELVHWGANVGSLTTNGEWHRLLTSLFINSGAVHLAVNMFALLFVGSFLEPYIGSKTFAVTYLLTGIIAGFCCTLLRNATIVLGVSSAIFGMYGVLLSLKFLDRLKNNMPLAFKVSIVLFVALSLFESHVYGYVNNAVNIIALFSGFFIGVAYFSFKRYLKELD